ncbi:MAG: M1 family metallopeptidase [Phycisphaerales bacterium]
MNMTNLFRNSRFGTLSLLAAAGLAVGLAQAGETTRESGSHHGDDEKSISIPTVLSATGAENVVWRKDQLVDWKHTAIELDIPDVTQPVLTGIVTHTGTVCNVGLAMGEVVLDCNGPEVVSVWVDGALVPPAGVVNGWTQQVETLRVGKTDAYEPGGDGQGQVGGKLIIPIPTSRGDARGQAISVTIKYNLNYGGFKGNGLTLAGPATPPAEGENKGDYIDSPSSGSPMIHAQGESEFNSRWFPCFDSPQERATSEVMVTVDSGYEVVSNGSLVAKLPATTGSVGQPRTKWHWKMPSEHPPYLVTLAVGKFDIVNVSDSGVPMPVYTAIGTADHAKELFANTPAMVRFMESITGEPFPWPQYAQVMVRGFRWGGMENTGATFLKDTTIRRNFPESDGLIVHELAHQWFGDLITCRHWDHIWLNEGFATYSEALWFEHAKREGIVTAGEYQKEVNSWLRELIAKSKQMSTDPTRPEPPLVSARYSIADDTFEKRDNPYTRGPLMLHAIRMRVGDGVFFEGIKRYVAKFKGTAVETDDFRRLMEEVYGRSLERAFDQWTMRAGVPFVNVQARWDDNYSQLKVTMTQTQAIDAKNPAHVLRVPIKVTDASGVVSEVIFAMDAKEASQSFVLSSRPSRIDIDPMVTEIASFQPRAFDPTNNVVLPDTIEVAPVEVPAEPAEPATPVAQDVPAGVSTSDTHTGN